MADPFRSSLAPRPLDPEHDPARRRFAGREDRVLVLRQDRDLAEAVPSGALDRAEAASAAAVVQVPRGTWDAGAQANRARGGFGLLVLDGALIRRVGLLGRFGAEVLGPGDLLQPWRHDGEGSVVPFETAWRVIAPLRLAVLDTAWTARMAGFPEVFAELAGRGIERSRRLAVMMAIAQHPRLDERLWLLFWALAERHGTVRADGVHLPLVVTREHLGHLVAARRPSVSAALGRLQRDGRMRALESGWLLLGSPPRDAI